VCERFAGELVNADSVQVFRYFDIGSAKTPAGERRGIRHHLVDICQPDQLFTAGDYSRMARQAVADVTTRGLLPIVAGGTGFYVSALLDGLFDGPPRNEELRERLVAAEQRRPGVLHRWLRVCDPRAALRIHPNDKNKTIRALEVIRGTGSSLSAAFAAGRDQLTGYRVLKLGLNPPRDALYERINRRSEEMFTRGLVEEVRAILAAGYSESAKPFESLGYAQALRVIRGEMSREEAIADTAMQTRRYAKRQWTWFRRDPAMEWIGGFGNETETQSVVFRRVSEFLGGR
jgi:tRNA dimethylallyltransferase